MALDDAETASSISRSLGFSGMGLWRYVGKGVAEGREKCHCIKKECLIVGKKVKYTGKFKILETCRRALTTYLYNPLVVRESYAH